MFRFCVLWLLLAAGCGLGQEVRLDAREVSPTPALIAPDEEAVIYDRSNGDEVVLAAGSALGRHRWNGRPARLIWFHDGRISGEANLGGQVITMGASARFPWVFYQTIDAAGRMWHAQNVRTGSVQHLANADIAYSSAIHGDVVAVLVPRGPATELRLLDCASLQTRSGAQIASSPTGLALSFASADRLLVLHQFEGAYTPVAIADSPSPGTKIVLRGPEIEFSRTKASASRQAVVRGVGGVMIAVAHSPSESGRDLFFLSPYKETEGYRVVEYDASGNQTRCLRVVIPESARGAGSSYPAQPMIAALSGEVLISTRSGQVLAFPR